MSDMNAIPAGASDILVDENDQVIAYTDEQEGTVICVPNCGSIKPNNQAAPGPIGNTQGIIVPQTAPEASGEGNSAPTPKPTEEESGWWSSWGSALTHGVLDVVGLIPVVGEVADGVNAVIYLAEGDKVNAALSAAAMLPIGGQAATAAKLGMKGAEATKAAGKATAEAGAKATREGAEAGAEQASKRVTTGKDGGHIDGPKKQGENEGGTGEVPNNPNRGLTFVGENLGTPRNSAIQAARDFESGTTGAFSDIATRQRQVPALRYDNPNPNGAPFVKFDGYQQLDDGVIEIIDSKTRIVPFSTREGPFISPSVRDGLVRKSEAISQNPGYRGVIELPTTEARREAQQVLRQLGITNISTRVR